MGTLRFFEEVVSFKIRRTFGFADYKFTVDQAGSVGDIKILQSPDKCFSDEVTRILESSPKWTPGRDEKGDAVKVSLVIPVDFRMTAEKPSEN